jgi:dihydroorotase
MRAPIVSEFLKAIPAGDRFEPLMTLYLTEHTNPDDVEEPVITLRPDHAP